MNRAELAKTLALMAANDRRDVDATTVASWDMMLAGAVTPDISFDEARAAVVAFYRTETRWMMVADMIQLVRAARREQITRRESEQLHQASVEHRGRRGLSAISAADIRNATAEEGNR